MFLYNRGHFGTIDGVNPHGVVLASSSIQYEKITKRQSYTLPMVLLDPQYYLHSINKTTCAKAVKNLETYPWYQKNKEKPRLKLVGGKLSRIKPPAACSVVSSHSTEEEISECIRACFDIQKQIDVTEYIIPTPLAVAREDQFSEQLKWLKIATKLKDEYDKPFFATIAISDKALLDCDFEDNQMIQTILDNAPLLPLIDGYYVVVERSSSSLQVTEGSVARALLELSYNLGQVENKKVIINFADTFGLLCLAVGATAFGSGYNTKERRLSFVDFEDKGGGMSLPEYFSTSLIGDFYSERDLKKIVSLKLFRYLSSDIITAYSNPLLQSLNVKGKIVVPPAWSETRSNVAAASKHRIECLSRQAEYITGMTTIEKRLDFIQTWLQDAEARMEYLKGRLKGKPLSETGSHISVWRETLEQFVDDNF
jgi:hypothetical protein